MSQTLRIALVQTAQAAAAAGLSPGTAGNFSVRHADGYLITPSAIPAHELEPNLIVPMGIEEEPPAKALPRPSSEWRFHRDIYKAHPEANAIVHGHPPFATALACLGRAIPAFHYMVAVAGGKDIRCAAYATFGTQALSENVMAALSGRRACLMANHGLVAFGSDLFAALQLAREIETLATQYHHALAIAEPNLLDDAEMDRVLALFGDYKKAGRPTALTAVRPRNARRHSEE